MNRPTDSRAKVDVEGMFEAMRQLEAQLPPWHRLEVRLVETTWPLPDGVAYVCIEGERQAFEWLQTTGLMNSLGAGLGRGWLVAIRAGLPDLMITEMVKAGDRSALLMNRRELGQLLVYTQQVENDPAIAQEYQAWLNKAR